MADFSSSPLNTSGPMYEFDPSKYSYDPSLTYDPSSVFNNPTTLDKDNLFDWGTRTPFSDPYQPSIQQNAPAQTNWTDILKGVGIAAGGIAKGIDAYRGVPSRPGNPFDQFMAQEAEKERYGREKELISTLLKEYLGDKEKKGQDPDNLLWFDRVLNPTAETRVAGVTDSPRMAGSIFGMS